MGTILVETKIRTKLIVLNLDYFIVKDDEFVASRVIIRKEAVADCLAGWFAAICRQRPISICFKK